MFKRFYPDLRCKNTECITDEFFKENNIRYAVLDIDNTLVAYTSPKPDKRAREFLARLEGLNITYCFVSNNHEERVKEFCEGLSGFYIADSRKPLIFNIKRAMRRMGAKKGNTVLIGDQIFTDVYAANRAGLYSVMVDPIEPKETPFFGFKRALERVVMRGYNHNEDVPRL